MSISEPYPYIELGFRHIVSPEALDHILFLLALGAVYRWRDWRDSLWVISAFTVGHSITLALAATGVVQLPTRWIEFLIPVTILVTCGENILAYLRRVSPRPRRHRGLFAALFGLVHGAGFANYLKALFIDRIAVPLFGFNLGIELGQLVILLVAGAGFTLVDGAIGPRSLAGGAPAPLRFRVLAVSGVVLVFAGRMAFQRAPW